MVVIDVQKEILVMDSIEKMKLREERRRTGRYMAAGVAIFLSLLGLYQAVARGTPEYAALFAPALIMFIYILWILYASKSQMKSVKDLEKAKAQPDEVTPDWNIIDPEKLEEVQKIEKDNADKENRQQHMFSRSYSIA
ncbi:PREDICTED: uncharacterized protein LOC108556420 [Nicrophorus vespilloides]|uniref:Uncharacterized protein LOC108556420 n=1 Tax=Nicrophorus vespilloides TaxID=110193 RepID=A0ABM1M0D3_NICVS|nr:PREDICTED: uncharacterized protein LOC108556420 [Nicrophorus vespilloides]